MKFLTMRPIEWAIVGVVLILLSIFAYGGYNNVKTQSSQETYQVWCKVYNRQDLTYEEWLVARRAGYFIDYHVARP